MGKQQVNGCKQIINRGNVHGKVRQFFCPFTGNLHRTVCDNRVVHLHKDAEVKTASSKDFMLVYLRNASK